MKYLILLLALLFMGCQGNSIMDSVVQNEREFVLAPALDTYTEVADTPKEEVKPGKHPYFDDKEVLKWYRDASFDSALKSGKHLILEIGREQCGLCQKFVEKILPLYKKRLANYAGVESNVDKMHSTIQATVLRYMKHATLLPVIIVVNSKGQYIGGLYGDISKQKKKFEALLKKCDESVKEDKAQ